MIPNDQAVAENIAKRLLEIEAVQFRFKQPFRWSSGWNSPIYCDSRLTISYPKIRQEITQGFVGLVQKHFSEVEAFVGVATSGIPQAALLAQDLNLPMLYVRSKNKGHGKENLLEGKVLKGQKVVVVEDIISTGGSAIQAANALRAAGLEVLGIIAILTYDFDFTRENLDKNNYKCFTLTDYTRLLVEVFKKEGVSEETMASLHEWRKNPQNWEADL